MIRFRPAGATLLFTMALSVLTGCGTSGGTTGDAAPAPVELGTFPYHPLVYHLDLSILAYQIHGQSLAWPFDPYYEERANPLGTTRNDFMARVRTWARNLPNPNTVNAYRGPGIGLDQNPGHDPIVYNYSRVHPWSSCVMNSAEQWTEYLTPRPITARIREVSVAYRYRPAVGPEELRIEALSGPTLPGDRDADGRDLLYAFEGGTGDKGEPGMPPSQSLMGCVLVRSTGASSYDLHITFRGSRSGTATRAFFEALSTNAATGNPDWITDLGFAAAPEPLRSVVTSVGNVARGFATSIRSINPQLFACLERVASVKGVAPTNIYLTGHSLGGALAQDFASVVLLGTTYGPNGSGPAMAAPLRAWPWQQLKLITFGAPRSGDEDWARALTAKLASDYYDRGIIPFDGDAFPSSEVSIVPRLLEAGRPAAFRVLISTDPITSAIPGDDGQPVGKTVYVNKDQGSVAGLPSTADHEPEAIRNRILSATRDQRTPAIAWRYRSLSELPPTRSSGERGSLAGFQKLRDATLAYYSSSGQWFDTTAFLSDFTQLLAIP